MGLLVYSLYRSGEKMGRMDGTGCGRGFGSRLISMRVMLAVHFSSSVVAIKCPSVASFGLCTMSTWEIKYMKKNLVTCLHMTIWSSWLLTADFRVGKREYIVLTKVSANSSLFYMLFRI